MNGEVLTYGPDVDEDEAREEARKEVQRAVRQLSSAWKDMLASAYEVKQEKFGDDAAEALSFFNEDHSFIWESLGESINNDPRIKDAAPGFEMTYNVVAELVQIFGPYVYHRNPSRLVEPIKPLEFPVDAIVDPVLQYESESLSQQLEQAIIQAAGPLVQNAVNNGIPQDVAQQQAQQAVMQYPPIAALQQQLAEVNGELSKQMEYYGRMQASQRKSMAKKSAKSTMMQRILNYTPRELNLREHSRRVVDEAIIKGQGVWWTELKEFDDDDRVLVGSFYDSVDNLLIDPDVADFEDAMWVARKRSAPVWQLEQRFDLPPKSIRGTSVSNSRGRKKVAKAEGLWSSTVEQPDNYKPSNDVVVYYEIYSKMGIGSRLEGVPEEIRSKLEKFGDYCYVVICDGCDYPLNLSIDALYDKDPDDLFMDVQWPIPFHKDDSFPCTPLTFHWVPNSPWGMSHIKPGIGELKFLDFAMSHLARKIKSASVDIIGVLASAADDIKKQLETPDDGSGYKIVEIASHYGKSVAELFSVMQRPPFHGDIWNVIAAVADRLDRRLGLTELYRSGGVARSALDAKNKQESFAIRPQDMAKRVEEQSSILCRKEAMAIAWFMEGKDVAPIIGEEAAFLYDELIYKQDPIQIVREYDYQIEADSIRRPSKETEQENMAMLTQSTFNSMSQMALSTGNFEPINAFFRDLGKAYNMDTEKYNFTPPPPPPPSPEQMQLIQSQKEIAALNLQAQMQQARNLETQMRVAELQLVNKLRSSETDVVRREQLAQLDIEAGIREMEQKLADAALQRRIDMEEHEQEMKQDAEAFRVTLEANKEGGGDAKMMTNYRRDYRGYR